MRTACIVLDCISSLCDGQNREMQKLLQGKELTLKVASNISVLYVPLARDIKPVISHRKSSA